MWDDILRDPWAGRFQTGNPFAGFGGFYPERSHPFWENPVYFPHDKPRRVSNRNRARRVEDRASASHNIPVCCQARENSSTKELDVKLKDEANRASSPTTELSQPEFVEIPVNIQPSKDEDVSDESSEETFYDANEDAADDTGESQREIVEAYQSGDEGPTSQTHVNDTTTDAGNVKKISPAQPEMQIAEEQKLNSIKNQLAKAKELTPRVQAFEGSRQDKEFLYLEEHLTRCILGLDLIDAEGLGSVKVARKAAVKEILSVINDLDSRVSDKS